MIHNASNQTEGLDLDPQRSKHSQRDRRPGNSANTTTLIEEKAGLGGYHTTSLAKNLYKTWSLSKLSKCHYTEN